MLYADFLITIFYMSIPHILQILLEIGESFDFLNKRYGLKLQKVIKLNVIIDVFLLKHFLF